MCWILLKTQNTHTQKKGIDKTRCVSMCMFIFRCNFFFWIFLVPSFNVSNKNKWRSFPLGQTLHRAMDFSFSLARPEPQGPNHISGFPRPFFWKGDSRIHLVGGFNPLKNISQNGNLPQIRVNIKKSSKPPPSHILNQTQGMTIYRGFW